jgi:hypothetical protein
MASRSPSSPIGGQTTSGDERRRVNLTVLLDDNSRAGLMPDGGRLVP